MQWSFDYEKYFLIRVCSGFYLIGFFNASSGYSS